MGRVIDVQNTLLVHNTGVCEDEPMLWSTAIKSFIALSMKPESRVLILSVLLRRALLVLFVDLFSTFFFL